MSKKNQRQLPIISESRTIFSTRQQARLIRNEALQMIESANEFTTNTRRVNRRSAFRVISRSLHSSEGLPFSVRKHQALTELSNYIALAKYNKVVGLTAFNTDLLPLTHPRSTRAHSMTASAMIRSHVKWVTDDPRITDDSAKALIASAMLASANSPEKFYAITRLENLPQGHVPLEAMTAAYGGGNSAAAKRARVALQLRDRLGRWVEMFGGLGIKVKRRDGSTSALTGRAVGQNIFSPALADVELNDGRIVAMPIRQARGGTFLPSDESRKDGFTKSGSTADDMSDPILEEADLTFMESPSSFDKDEKGIRKGITRYTDQAYNVDKYDDNKRALADLTETNKRRAELDLDDAAVDKQGETDPDSGKQFWDPSRPIYAVSRRGGTPFAYTQSWSDAQKRIQADQRFLDEEEGRTPLAQIVQDDNTPEDETPLVDQQDKFKKEEIARLPEPATPAETPKDFKYKVPEDTYEVSDPTAPYRSVSEYDDPASLANMFQGDELIEGLDDSLDTGLGRLQFPEEGEDRGGEQEVPAEAILKAIDEKGGDAELALAQAYDKRLGTSENEDALYAQREADKEGKIGEPKKLGEVFDEVTKGPEAEPEVETPVEETPVAELPQIDDEEPMMLPPALEGLTLDEQADFLEDKNYSKYLSKDEPVDWPEEYTAPQDRELTPLEREQAINLANSDVPDEDLATSYNGAVKNQFDEDGFAPFSELDENNEEQTVQVASEVLRDAMKLRNFDMDETNKQVLDGNWDEVDEEDEVVLEEEPDTELTKPSTPDEGKGTKAGKDPLKQGWKPEDWINEASKDPRFQEMLKKNKDFTRLAGLYNDPTFDSPIMSDYQDKEMDGFESGSEVEAIDLGETGFEASPAGRVKYALDLLEDPTMSARAGFKDFRTGERSAENERNILKAADEQLDLAKQDLSESDVIENKAIDSVRATLAKEIAKLDKKIEKDSKKAEQDALAPQASYQLKNGRLDLRSKRKAPFKKQEIKDFLDDNGFEWNDPLKAEVKSGMSDQEAKALLKELKDRFGIELLPRDGQTPIDLDAVDETPEPAVKEVAPEVPATEAPSEEPKEKPLRQREDEYYKDLLFPGGTPEGWTFDEDGSYNGLYYIRDLTKENGDRIQGVYPKDEERPPYYLLDLATDGVENRGSFKSLQEVLDFYNNQSGTEEKAPEAPVEETPIAEEPVVETPEVPETPEDTAPVEEEPAEPKVKMKEATFDPENPASQEYAKETLKKLVEDRKLINEEIKNAAENGLTTEEFDALVEMRDQMNEKIDKIVNEVPTDALTSDNDISKAKKDEDPEDNYIKEEPNVEKSKKELKKEAKRRKELILKMIFSEFGPGALNLENPERGKIRQFADILDTLTTAELEEIGTRLNEELGWNFFRSKKGPSKPGDVTVESEGDNTQPPRTEPEDIVDAEIVPDATEEEPSTELPVAPEATPEAPNSPAEEPAEAPSTENVRKTPAKLKVGDEVYIPGEGWRTVTRIRKWVNESSYVGRKGTTYWAVDYVDEDGNEGSWRTKPFGGGFNEEKTDNKLETRPATPKPEVISKSEKASKIAALTSELLPGDVSVDDYFTITKIEPGFSKKRDGVVVPSSWITGYYPGSKEQRTKLWADDITFDIYRGVTPPAKGELDELSKPDMKESGDIEKIGVDPKGNNIWDFKNPADRAKYEEKLAEYRDELERRKATWQAPEVEEEAPTFTEKNTLHVVHAVGKDLKPGDIAFKKDGDELGEFFVIEEVLPGTVMVERADKKPAEEKVQIRGYYPGHESQVKAWKVGTGIDVLRGEDPANIPAKGDKPAIESIAPGTLKGQAYKDKNAEIAALRKEASKSYTPNIEAVEIPKVLVEEPNSFFKGNLPAFLGSAKELTKLKDGKAIWEALKSKRVVYFDFETIGKGFDMDEPDQPIQLAAAVYENGEKVEEINLFINPEVPLDDYYYSEGKGKNKKPYLVDGVRSINPDRLIDNDGVAVDDAFLATQPSIKEQLQKFAELIGKDAILVAHNAEFDTNTFEKWAQKLGIDYEFGGVIDTMELARTFKNRYNDLEAVSNRYGIEKDPSAWHNAATDSEVLPEILEKLLADAQPDNPQFDPDARMEEFKATRSSYLRQLADWRKQQSELAAATAVKDALAGKPVSVEDLTAEITPTFGADGSTDSGEVRQHESILGGVIDNDWIEDDENTFAVDEGGATVRDIRLFDFVPGENGGYLEVIDLIQDPEDPDGTVVVRQSLDTGAVYGPRVKPKKSPGIGWSNGKILEGTLRRRNELIGKTNAELRELLDNPVVVDPVPTIKPETSVTKGSKTATADEVQGTVADAIETITSGSKPDATVEEAIKSLPVDETIKTLVLEDRADGSMYHISADGTPLKVGDKVRSVKTGRIGEVKAFIGSYGTRGYKNYVKVKYDDAAKRENVSANTLQIIDDGGGDGPFKPDAAPATGEPINPNTTPKSKEELAAILDSPIEPIVTDREARLAQHELDEEKRMKYAMELNYRKVSPEALKELKEAVNNISVYGKGHKRSFIAFMPNLSTGEPLRSEFTFLKPTKDDIKKYGKEEGDILVKYGPLNTAAIIKSDGTIDYLYDNRATDNFFFSVTSPDLYTAVENKDKVTFPLGENPNLQAMGMVPLDREIPIDDVVGPNGETNSDFVFDDPEEEPKSFKPSEQQKAIVAAVSSGKDVIVQALAGTGKTTTLKMAARAVAEKDPDKTILYIAFNRSVAAEINQDPDRPKNLIARTDSQVVWHHAPKWLQDRGFDKTLISRNLDVAKYLGITPTTVTLIKKDGTKDSAELSTLETFDLIKKAVVNFSQSSDEKVMPKHFDETLDNVPSSLIDSANSWWDDISNPKGKLAVNRSFFSKYVQLNGIDVSKASLTTGETKIPATDIIFFDEAQDINDVTASWVRSQKMQKVFVGDGNQSIYMFRGAKNQLETLEGADTLQLTESYRFGPNIAGIANRFLTFNGKTEKVIGLNKDQGELVSVEDMPDPNAVLVRTNGGALKAMQEYLDQGKTVGISKSLYTRVVEALDTIGWLNAGKPKDGKPENYNPEIGNYDSFKELSEEVAAGRAGGIKSLYDLYVRTGAENLRELLKRVVVQEEDTEESKAAKSVYSPITIDQAEDGSSGKLSDDVSYKIVGETIVLDVSFIKNAYYRNILNDNLRKAGVPARKTGKKIKNYKGELVDEWTRDTSIPDDLDRTDKLNKIKKILNGIVEPVIPDLVVTTAHISKGDEWDNVRIYEDFAFFGPRDDKETGNKIMPDEQEVNLAYVAVTRAKKKIALGPLSWVYEYTEDSDEQAPAKSFTLQAMANIPTDPVAVTPEEFNNEILETAKKIDPATQKIADAIIAALEAGTPPWRKPWTGGGFLPTSVATGKMYEGSNILVLWAAQERNGWTDNRWLTYKQAEKLGGNIKRGEKATSIIHWTPKFKDVKQPDGTIEKEFVYTPPKIINVFNVEQAEGINLPPLVQGDPVPVSQAEQILLDTYKDRPEIFYKSQDSAYYSPVTDTIHLPLREQFGSEQDLFETLVHELAHSTGHTSRENRKDLLDNYGTHKASRGEEELIAEISVAIAAARLGVEIDFGNVASYAKSWLGALKNDPTMIIKAAKQAQKAVDRMLGKQEEPATVDEEGNPIEPVGEGVGSEGRTGDQIVEDAGLKPEPETAPTSGTTKGYAGFHSAPTREYGSPLHDVTANGIYPENVYSKRGEQIYGTGHREGLDPEAHKLILSMRGKPDAIVKVYRSIPSDVEGEINPGDWVTPFKAYAEEHGESNLNNDYKIVTLDVKASDIFTEGNSWLEWGYDPATTPEPNLGEEGKTGEEIATETGVASLTGQFQKDTPNSGELKDGMNYEIQMIERVLNSGQTSGGTYGVRKIVVSGNTFKNKEELKAAGFRYDAASKTWSKSYLKKVFNVETLTQDVVDKNPDPEITEDLSKFLNEPLAQRAPEEGITSATKTPKNIDPNVEAERVKYGSEMHTMWNDVTYDPELKNDWRIEGGSGVMFDRLMENQEVISNGEEIFNYVEEMLAKYGYGDRIISFDMNVSEIFFKQNPQYDQVEAGVIPADTSVLPKSDPFRDKDIPALLVRKRGTTKVALLHEIAHIMEASWKSPTNDGGHNSAWFATWVTLLRSEGFTTQANLLEMAVYRLDEGDTGVINP